MNAYKYCVSLRFSGIGFEPDDISKALSLLPKQSWNAGDQITKSSSRGNRTTSYWSHTFESLSDADFESSLSGILEPLLIHKMFFHEMISRGIDISLFVGLFGNENYSFAITNAHSKSIAELGIEIGFDVYPFPNAEAA